MISRIGDYISDVGAFKMLTPDESAALAKRHSRQAREQLVEANLRLSIFWAKRFAAITGIKVDIEDLIQEGNIGLIIAAKRFDPAKGRFSTIATHWVKQKIRRYIEEHADLVQGPGWFYRDLLLQWKRAAEKMGKELNREPSVQEVQEKARLTKRQLAAVKIALKMKNVRSLDWFSGDDGEGRQTELADPKETKASLFDLRRMLNTASFALTEREKAIIDGHFFEKRTLEDMGRKLGVSRERVRQVEAVALRKMREYLTSQGAPLRLLPQLENAEAEQE